MAKNTMDVNENQIIWLSTLFKYVFFSVKQKKESHMMTEFFFLAGLLLYISQCRESMPQWDFGNQS